MAAIAQTVASLLGDAQVTRWEAVTAPLKQAVQGAIADHQPPDCIVYPETSEQLAEVVACAHRNGWHLLPCGHGSKLGWGGIVAPVDVVISTQRLARIVDHAVGDFTVTLEAGVAVADVQATLGQTRQFLAIDPAYAHQATLGGVVATRDTGARRQRYGGIRDMLIGVSLVRYDGQLARAGGRVVKNVAGYDLMKLMAGSFGTLGILTQLTFRTYPLPEVSTTALVRGPAEAIQGVATEIRLSSLTPVAMDLLSPGLLPGGASDDYGLALQFQTSEAGITEQMSRLQAIAASHSVTVEALTGPADAQFWDTLTQTLFPVSQAAVIARLGISPAQGMALLTHLQTLLAPGTWQARIHASSGVGTLCLSDEANSVEMVQAIRAYCQAAGGYGMLLVAPPAWKAQCDPWALPPSVQTLMTRLRDQFDPQRHLSPGRFP